MTECGVRGLERLENIDERNGCFALTTAGSGVVVCIGKYRVVIHASTNQSVLVPEWDGGWWYKNRVEQNVKKRG